MGNKKGRSVPCPLGPPPPKRRAQPKPEGSSQIVAALEANDALWVNHQSQEIQNAQANTAQPDEQLQNPQDLFDSDDEINRINDINPNEDHLINHWLPNRNDVEEPPEVHNFGDYVRGSTYKHKQLREAENWKKVFGPMFLDFMVCSQRTSQWGNGSWDEDRNRTCACGPGKHRRRKVDMLDLTSRKQMNLLFCDCVPDQVRLIRMGYIGGSPKHPEAAFSIRLLRFHHTMWNYCTVRTQGFTLALDEYLDAACPLILVSGTSGKNEPRRWRKPFSSAVDAYRQMLQNQDDLTIRALELTTMERLALNCPRCFGPLQDNPDIDEPDYIVCLDGNFQHRRHKLASQEYDEKEVKVPHLFIDPAKVAAWETRGPQKSHSNVSVILYSIATVDIVDADGKSPIRIVVLFNIRQPQTRGVVPLGKLRMRQVSLEWPAGMTIY
ncbi:hypothetical protein DFH28DRAFT_899824 [Melampsora americana]|nr:hypothetical protein DFH28DRAFT_899824 [Melampsora americana]